MTPSATLLVAAGYSAPQVYGARFGRDPSTVSSRSCLGELGRRAKAAVSRSAYLRSLAGSLIPSGRLLRSCCRSMGREPG